MKLTKQDVCVFIENEQQLQEAREMLEGYSRLIDHSHFYLDEGGGDGDNLMYDELTNKWHLSYNVMNLKKITLPELEQILKDEHGKV